MSVAVPNPLRLENKSRFLSIDLPKWIAPLLVAALACDALWTFASALRDADAIAGFAWMIKCVFYVGGAYALWTLWQRRQVEAIELADRVRFYDRGRPIAFDWNQVGEFWYEGVRNPARVKVTNVRPSTKEDRVLVVGLRWGPEFRLRVSPADQEAILAWAQYIERERDVHSHGDSLKHEDMETPRE